MKSKATKEVYLKELRKVTKYIQDFSDAKFFTRPQERQEQAMQELANWFTLKKEELKKLKVL